MENWQNKLKSQEKVLLYKLVNSESQGESDLDQRRVCSVVLNRVKSCKFPNTVSEVIYQKNQFSGVGGRMFTFDKLNPNHVRVKRNVDWVLRNGPVTNALFFCNPKIANSNSVKWMRTLKQVATGKNHHFFL